MSCIVSGFLGNILVILFAPKEIQTQKHKTAQLKTWSLHSAPSACEVTCGTESCFDHWFTWRTCVQVGLILLLVRRRTGGTEASHQSPESLERNKQASMQFVMRRADFCEPDLIARKSWPTHKFQVAGCLLLVSWVIYNVKEQWLIAPQFTPCLAKGHFPKKQHNLLPADLAANVSEAPHINIWNQRHGICTTLLARKALLNTQQLDSVPRKYNVPGKYNDV